MPLTASDAQPAVRIPYTDFSSQWAVDGAEVLQAIEQVLRRGDFILGKDVEVFEQECAVVCGVAHAIGVSSGTDALLLALKALGIGPGDEVITPPNSWISSTSSIVWAGATPVFADVGENFLIDPARVEAAITPRTKAIMPVHLTGRCADTGAIGALARRHGLAVIEDAAQAVGARDAAGRLAGSLGTVGCFSLHPLKNLSGMGDGGIVTTNDDALAQRIRLLRNHGLRSRDEVVVWGWNARLDTVQAAALRCRLKRLAAVTEARRRHAAFYQARLSSVVTCPVDRTGEYAIYHLFMIQCDRRDALKQFLTQRGIETKIHYPMPIHLQPCSASLGYRRGDLPVAEAQAQRILSLPVHHALSEDDVASVASAVLEFYQESP